MTGQRPRRAGHVPTPDEALAELRDEWATATTDAERAELAVIGHAVRVVADVLRHPADRRTR